MTVLRVCEDTCRSGDVLSFLSPAIHFPYPSLSRNKSLPNPGSLLPPESRRPCTSRITWCHKARTYSTNGVGFSLTVRLETYFIVITISSVICTVRYTVHDICQFLHVSALRCYPQGVITKVCKPTCQSRFCCSF
jgi:hypothetical protein